MVVPAVLVPLSQVLPKLAPIFPPLPSVLDQLTAGLTRVLPRDPKKLTEKRILSPERPGIAAADVLLDGAKLAKDLDLAAQSTPALGRVANVVAEIPPIVARAADVVAEVAPQLARAPPRLPAIGIQIAPRLRRLIAEQDVDAASKGLLGPFVPVRFRAVEARHHPFEAANVAAIAASLTPPLDDLASVLAKLRLVPGKIAAVPLGLG